MLSIMAEAIISRRGSYGSSSSGDPEIPIMPGYCVILAKVSDIRNTPVSDIRVTCQDGGQSYNYTTNESGYVMFTTNSGQANITAQNISNAGIQYYDVGAGYANNVAAMIGTSQRVNITMNDIQSFSVYAGQSANIQFIRNRTVSGVLGAGGGGGGGSGSGGGGGAQVILSGIVATSNTWYNVYCGKGGSGGSSGDGSSGGSTSAFGRVANGGEGGSMGAARVGGIGADGGAWGNGAGRASSSIGARDATESINSLWGGGGGGGRINSAGATPSYCSGAGYGGDGGRWESDGRDAVRGGGGGGGGVGGGGGSGGDGMITINLAYRN